MLTDEPRESFPDRERNHENRQADETMHLYDRLDELADRVSDRSLAGVVVFDGAPLAEWESNHGASSFDELMVQLGDSIRDAVGDKLRRKDIVCRNAPAGDSILLFLSKPREDSDQLQRPDFTDIADRARDYLTERATDEADEFPGVFDQIETGTALIVGKDGVDPRRELYRAVRRARLDVRESRQRQRRRQREVVNHVITQQQIETVYQPIVALPDETLFGFEALSRPPSPVESKLTGKLFRAAEEAALAPELDQLCRRLSVDRRPPMELEAKLFVNCLPSAFFEGKEGLEALVEEWQKEGLAAEQLVFELNEHITQSQADRILPTIDRLRKHGCQFALDDMGTGKTNLRLLAELEPSFIKMDISLTRGIADSVRKKALASYLLDLADNSDASLIAEGIESERDYETIIDLGVHYGQGHAIAPPSGDGDYPDE